MKNRCFLLLSCCFTVVQLSAQNVQTPQNQNSGVVFPSGEQFIGIKFTYTIIPAANNTWCYDILTEGRLFIHQPSAPGLPGNEGFKTKEAAGRVAEIVIGKLQKGQMPPSITVEEMKQIKVL